MVCARCQRLQKATELATPGVKRKNDLYYGSPASTTSKMTDKTKSSSGSSSNGVTKSKLLSKGAKNPYAAYASSCTTCKTKTEAGRTYCQRCAYKANACAMCGKSLTKDKSTGGAPIVQGQRFSAK
ncbi:MAG: hypothetical protein M1817_001227 [Caeruleum heppii]|nr:MAG: hypothetical protein M1817_001227 [Caeruleum heppii]